MRIKNVVFHHILKEQKSKGPASVKSEYAKELLQPDDPIVIDLCQDILKSYRDHNPMHGNIKHGSDFQNVLQGFFSEKPIEFMEFTENVCGLIEKELSKSFLANGGFVLLLNYEDSQKDWLLIVMLKNDEGYGLTKLLTLEKRQYLNIEKLNESARIDVEKWKSNLVKSEESNKNCLSFMKGKKTQDEDVTEYFRFALSCDGYITSKQNTKNLVDTIFNYMESKNLEPSQKEAIRDSLFLYFEKQHKLGEEVDLDTIANTVNAVAPSEFTDYLKEKQIDIDYTFRPNPTSYRKFKRIGYTNGNVKISFTYNDLNETVFLNKEGYLILKSVPQHIIEEIHRATPQAIGKPE